MLRSLVTEFPFQTSDRSTVRQTCQEACAQTENCRYFTWYERDGAFPFSCFLFSSCDREEPCQDCISGPEICLSEEDSQCKGIEEDYGGSWYCFPDAGLGNPVPSGTKCIWQCPGQSSYHECYNGRWNKEPGQARCMCQKIGTRHEGQVLCYPPHDMNDPVSSGTYCLHTCHGHPKTEMVCDHALWSNSPELLSCHGGSNFTSQSLSFSNLGSLVSRKLKEMKNKDKNEKPTLKTKIGNEILTMKKVNTVTDASDDDSVGSLAALLGAADNDNFFQQLQLSTPLRQQQQQRPQQQQQPDVNRFRQQQLNELRQQLGQLARPSIERPTQPPASVQFQGFQPIQQQQPPGGSLDPRTRLTTVNTPTIITLKIPSRVEVTQEQENGESIFPQAQDAPGLFSRFPTSTSNDDGGSNLFQVSGQLQVGSDDSSGSGWRSGTVQSIRHNPLPLSSGNSGQDSVTMKLERQMEKLHELENILRSSDQLSPVTLAMVENALRHLTDKRRTSSSRTGKEGPIPPPDTDLEAPPLPPLHGGPSPPSGIQPVVTEETLTGRSRTNVNADAILSNLGKVTAKGTAPILLPHPGGNMVPMSDSAVLKQHNLRKLRIEMLKMKEKLKSLESEGINPTRDHVMNHLDAIKDLTFEERPIWPTDRLNRNTIETIIITPDGHVVNKNKVTVQTPGSTWSTIQPPGSAWNTNQPEGTTWSTIKPPLLQSGRLRVNPPVNPVTQFLDLTTPSSSSSFRQHSPKREMFPMAPKDKDSSLQDLLMASLNSGQGKEKVVVENGGEEVNQFKTISVRTRGQPKLTGHVTENPSFDNTININSITDGEDDIEDILESFTELAKRFPQDFKRLVQSFSEEKEQLIKNPPVTKSVRFGGLQNKESQPSPLRNSFTSDFRSSGTCVKPDSPPHGKILCNSKTLGEGSKCILECEPGYLPPEGEIIQCSRGLWSRQNLVCERTVSLLIGGYNAEQGELSDVELYTPEGKCDPTRIAPLPQPRRGLVAAYIDGYVIACGGVNNTAENNICWKYNSVTNTWTETNPLHSERHFGSIVSASGTLIVLGGRDGSQTPMALGGMEQWRNGGWNEVNTKMSLERSYQCAASIARDELVVTGGYSWNTILARVESLKMSKGNSWKLLSPLGTPRYLHACSTLVQSNGDIGILVAGGYSQDYLNSTEIYDPKTNSWTYSGELSEPRQGGSILLVGGKPTIFGGFNNYDYFSWTYSGELSEPRQGGSILLVGGKPTIFGGFNNYDQYPTLVEQYDPIIGMWFPLREKLKKGRRYFAGVSVPQSMFPWCNP